MFVFMISLTTNIPSNASNSIQTLPEKSFKITSLANAPITISGNAQLANWSSSGNGSRENPYIIANYTINCTANTNGVNIQNTNKYFVLMNVNVSYCYDGFYLNNVILGTITKSFAINNTNNGFSLTGSSTNNTLLNDVAVNNDNFGFSLDTLSNNNSLINNMATLSIVADFSLIDASNNILRNNNATRSVARIIYISNGYIAPYSNPNDYYGFQILNSSDNIFSNNLASENENDGFYLAGSSNNVLSNNVANNNKGAGFLLTTYNNSSSSNNTLNSNTVSGNNNGFIISASNSNTLVKNTATQNGNNGFYLDYSSYNNLQNNFVTNNYDGFSLYYSDNNTLLNNIGQTNSQYDYYEVNSTNNFLANNIFSVSKTINNVSNSTGNNTGIVSVGTSLVILGAIILVGIGLGAFVYLKRESAKISPSIKKYSEYDIGYKNQPNIVSNIKICPACGLEAIPGDKYCMNCGIKLKT